MKKNVLLLILVSFCLSSCKESPQFHKSHYPEKAEAPFSDAVEANGFLFLSGQIGMDHNTRELVDGGIVPETKQAIENIREVLELHDSDLSQVIKVSVILKDIKDFNAFNKVYVTHFTHQPARTTFAASGLAKDAQIEIEVVAVK
ncbi:RidA family protein [Nonlabens sp. Ci31]|jgi:2-iminobutanoate/2-iminopropanoate deaminase|uniref:RidA family protein n=1 Tax=Nonlabens sp. Ci31 TaxID=2608253 RepID=UPI001462F65E|nr:Rid family detoxifying hydrolase [Nonlabens sp. Ci31]QJP33385.1 RidA family protein [Nonlabens sp. Ci31]